MDQQLQAKKNHSPAIRPVSGFYVVRNGFPVKHTRFF